VACRRLPDAHQPAAFADSRGARRCRNHQHTGVEAGTQTPLVTEVGLGRTEIGAVLCSDLSGGSCNQIRAPFRCAGRAGGNGEADHTSAPGSQATCSSTAVTAMLLGIAFSSGFVSP
jgi:hypothetical protein